jgi:hypothetical protein
MRKKFKGLSAKVLERMAKRRRERAERWLNCFLVVLSVLSCGGVSCLAFTAMRPEAPTWADFKPMKLGDVSYELTAAFMPGGVPAELTINGERWSLVMINHFNDVDLTKKAVDDPRMAQTDCKHRTISYIVTQDPERLRINLMHEVFHAGACLHGGDTFWNSAAVDDPKNPHPGIYHLGDFTATFLRDNPSFATWEAQ